MALGVKDSRRPQATATGRLTAPAQPAPAPAPAQPPPTASATAGSMFITNQAQKDAAKSRQAVRGRIGQPVEGRPGHVWADDGKGGAVALLVDPRAQYYAPGQTGEAGMPAAPTAPVDPTQTQPAPASTQANFDAARARIAGTQQPYGAAGLAGAAPARQTAAAQPGAQRPTVQAPTSTPGQPGGAPAPWQPASQDYSRYDAEAERLRGLQSTFLSQLERLSNSDPFGNQAALQKATDRAVAQAAGSAAGARGGAAAMAGAQRQAVGVQAQTAARGAQDIVEQRRRDEQAAVGLGLQAIGGAADIGKQLSANEIAMGDQAIKTAEVNLRGYLGGKELDQRERDSLRNFALEASKIDMQRYQTDMQYRAQVDNDLTQRYIAGTQLEAAYAKIKADENIGPADWLMGVVGLAAGGFQAAAMAGNPASDERVKTARAKPTTKALREFVEAGEGEFYEYVEPHKPGRRTGLNFGPMAQHLSRTKIGSTLVTPDRDGTLRVDAARLALADHSALTHLGRRLARLERKAGGRRGR